MDNMHNQFFPRAVAEGWLGVNYYTRFVIKGKRNLLAKLFAGIQQFQKSCQTTVLDASPTANQPMASQHQTWAGKSFEGLLKALKAMARFAKPLYIIENGVADSEDKLRQKFLKDHITILEKAAEEEKLDVRGYFHWALTDNYEWAKGFKVKFGSYAVNLQTKKRIMQKSAKTYKQIIEHSAG